MDQVEKQKPRQVLLWFAGGLALGTAVSVVVTRHRQECTPEPVQRVASAEPSRGAGESERLAQIELDRLRAQLAQKDNVIRALLTVQKQPDTASPPPTAAPEAASSATDPASKMIEALDDRMFAGPQDPARVAELEQASRNLANANALGAAQVTSLTCGSSICKLSLTATEPGAIDRAIGAIIPRLPKLFASSVAQRLPDGQTALYLARSGDDLDALGKP